MIGFRALSLRRGSRLLFDNASFALHPGQKVGVTGANGAGKSSLFGLVLGDLHPDSGELTLPPDWVIAHVAQETSADARSALDYVLDGDAELREIQNELAQVDPDLEGIRYAQLFSRFESIGGYEANARASRLLRGLGFSPGQEERPVAEFSGGWRMRLNLAKALMCRSDLLLLDEPTNHLDMESIEALNSGLEKFPGTMIFVSHDREFVSSLATRVLEVKGDGKIVDYLGGYEDYLASQGVA